MIRDGLRSVALALGTNEDQQLPLQPRGGCWMTF